MSEKAIRISKRNGVKNTVRIDNNTVVMNGFGNGNDAVPQKIIVGNSLEEKEPMLFNISQYDKQAAVVSGQNSNASSRIVYPQNKASACDNKYQSKKRQLLEMKYFGKDDFEDNIHIQIASKIEALYQQLVALSNLLVVTINNIGGFDENCDFIGFVFKDKYLYSEAKSSSEQFKGITNQNMPKGKLPEKVTSFRAFSAFCNKAKNRKDYFPELFTIKKGDKNIFDEERCYNVLRLVSRFRNTAMHTDKANIFETNFDQSKDKDNALKELIASLFDKQLNSINSKFIKTNKANINALIFLKKARNDKSQIKEIINSYYDFTIKKAQKNLGFNLTKVREAMLDSPKLSYIRSKEFDSVRGKLYKLFDYLLFEYYINHPDAIEALVNNLRFVSADSKTLAEELKQSIYNDEARRVLPTVINDWKKSLNIVTGAYKNSMPNDKYNYRKLLKSEINFDERVLTAAVQADNLSDFAKLIYVMTLFLDGKDANTAITNICNILSNINTFLNIAEQNNVKIEFNEQYADFTAKNTKKLEQDLLLIKSYAHMGKKGKILTNNQEFLDAAYLLGLDTNTAIEYVNNDMRNKPDDYINLDVSTDDKKIERYIYLIKEREKLARNFITNNVISSKKFLYICRFANPRSTYKLGKNKYIIDFVLGQLPESQLIRYAKTINLKFNANNPDFANIKEALSSKIQEVNFNDLISSAQKTNPRDNVAKEKMKAVVGLYLTIIYLFVKNLVRVNTIYSIAMSEFNKDNEQKEIKLNDLRAKDNHIENWKDNFGDQKSKNKVINNNYKLFCDVLSKHQVEFVSLFNNYRNNIEHLTIVNVAIANCDKITKPIKSYFDIYHYLMMLRFVEKGNDNIQEIINLPVINSKGEENADALSYKAATLNYQSACTSFLHILHAPLIYNHARYLNLSNRKLFMKSLHK